MRRRLSFLVTLLVLPVVLFAGGTAESQKSGDRLTIGFNNFLKGIYSLDILEKNFITTAKALGVDYMIVNDEGKIENSVTNVDNMIAAGVDGIVFFGISDTLFPVVAQKCEAAGVPYAIYDHMPSDAVLATFIKNKNFAGAAGTSDLATGRNIAEFALSQGLKQAIIISGETTDTTHSARTNGFTELFESAGGKVLAKGYGNVTIAEGMARADDLMTAHPRIDTIYATNGDLGTATIEALKKHPEITARLFVTDLDPDILAGLKSGIIDASNGAHWVNVDYATALLVSHLRGISLREADGSAPILIVPVMTLPSSYVDLYNTYWIENSPYSDEQLQSLVAQDVSLHDYQQMLDSYTIDNVLQEKVNAGLLSQSVLDSARSFIGK